MSNPKPRFCIVGLGLVGGSIGLALREAGVASIVVGHDKESNIAAQAKKRGVVDRTDWNLISACEQADLVILAIPVSEVEPTLKAIGAYLRPGCVVIDTASLKQPVLVWAEEHLPDRISFVGGNPIISRTVEGTGGVESATADLFRNGLFCLTPSVKAEPDAVKLATDLVAVLGARPLFLDPVEHDGLMAAVEQLPAVLALALMDTVIHQASWRELRKVAGTSFDLSTRLTFSDPVSLAELCMSNRDNLVRWIDTFSGTLASIRHNLVEQNADQMREISAGAVRERERWVQDRASGAWETGPSLEMPRSNVFADAFLGSWFRKRPKKDK